MGILFGGMEGRRLVWRRIHKERNQIVHVQPAYRWRADLVVEAGGEVGHPVDLDLFGRVELVQGRLVQRKVVHVGKGC